MRRFLPAFLSLLCAASVPLRAEHPVDRVQDVKRIYVAPPDGRDAELANLVSAKLVTYLAKHREISVVETPDGADAVLTGTGRVESQTNTYGRVSYRVQAAMRLDNKDGLILWADDISSSLFARSATSSFAENVAKKLLEAIFPEQARK
jgi:hypothetical protein